MKSYVCSNLRYLKPILPSTGHFPSSTQQTLMFCILPHRWRWRSRCTAAAAWIEPNIQTGKSSTSSSKDATPTAAKTEIMKRRQPWHKTLEKGNLQLLQFTEDTQCLHCQNTMTDEDLEHMFKGLNFWNCLQKGRVKHSHNERLHLILAREGNLSFAATTTL